MCLFREACEATHRAKLWRRNLIQNTAFTEAQSAFAFNGLLNGLIHLHSQKIVHRFLS